MRIRHLMWLTSLSRGLDYGDLAEVVYGGASGVHHLARKQRKCIYEMAVVRRSQRNAQYLVALLLYCMAS